MTETSYTAWDDKLYQWPPPEGWYLATDGKWWPEGYGPEPAPATDAASSTTTGDPTATSAPVGGVDVSATGAASRELDSLTDSASGWAETTAADRPLVERELPGSVAGVGDLVDPGTGSMADRADSLLAGSGRVAAEAAASEVADTTSPAAGATAASALTDHVTSIADGADGGRRRELPGSDDVAAALAETLGTRDGAEGPAAGDTGAPKGRTGSVEERAVAAVVDSAQAGAAEREIGVDPGDRTAGVTDAARGVADSTVDRAGSTLGQVAGADRSTFDDATQSLTGGLTPPVQLPLEQPPSTRPPIDTPTRSSSVDLDALPPPSFEPPAGPPLDAGPAAAGLGIDSPPPEHLPRAEGLPGPGDTIGDAPSRFAGPSPDETMVVPDTSGPDDGPGRVIGAGPGGVVDESVVTSAFTADPGAPGPTPGSPPPATGEGSPSGSLWADAGVPGPSGGPPGAGPTPASTSWNPGGPPGQAPPAIDLDRSVLANDPKPGLSRTLLLVGLGVIALLAIGILAFTLLSGGDDEPDSAAEVTGPGSLAEPHSRQTAVEVFYPAGDGERRWVIEVLEPVRDASGERVDPPAEGQVYAATRLRVGNQDTAATASLGELRFNAVTASGALIDGQAAACPTGGGAPIDLSASLGPAEVAEGEVCWVVPAADLAGLLLGIESTEVAGRIHIAMN